MTSNIETILWAVKIGDEDWQEQIITTNSKAIMAAAKWAKENGFDRFRISLFNPDLRPFEPELLISK